MVFKWFIQMQNIIYNELDVILYIHFNKHTTVSQMAHIIYISFSGFHISVFLWLFLWDSVG